MELFTSRLRLRPLALADLDAVELLNSDPAVMEFLGPALTRAESAAQLERIERHWNDHGFGLCGAELLDGRFVGWIGLAVPRFEIASGPCVEIGWRLARQHWGSGLATEGATAIRQWSHGELGLVEIVSFTARVNVRSIRVMERIGLHHDARDDFDHPMLASGDPLRPHVLYRGRVPHDDD